MSEDWDCDGGIWGSGSGRESGVGHADHGRGGLPYGGEGQRTRHQSDFRRALGDGGIWGAKSGGANSIESIEISRRFAKKRSLTECVTRVTH